MGSVTKKLSDNIDISADDYKKAQITEYEG
jgi:hypothetical protein